MIITTTIIMIMIIIIIFFTPRDRIDFFPMVQEKDLKISGSRLYTRTLRMYLKFYHKEIETNWKGNLIEFNLQTGISCTYDIRVSLQCARCTPGHALRRRTCCVSASRHVRCVVRRDKCLPAKLAVMYSVESAHFANFGGLAAWGSTFRHRPRWHSAKTPEFVLRQIILRQNFFNAEIFDAKKFATPKSV